MPSMLHLHHSPHQTSSVRRINRRAAIILPLAALLLAGLLELLARYGAVPLVALAYVATYAGVVMFAGWTSWHLVAACGHLVTRLCGRRGGAPVTDSVVGED